MARHAAEDTLERFPIEEARRRYGIAKEIAGLITAAHPSGRTAVRQAEESRIRARILDRVLAGGLATGFLAALMVKEPRMIGFGLEWGAEPPRPGQGQEALFLGNQLADPPELVVGAAAILATNFGRSVFTELEAATIQVAPGDTPAQALQLYHDQVARRQAPGGDQPGPAVPQA
jgi:hypothetical protein